MEPSHDRLDRIESTLKIQQLPMRYALALDSRDIETWLGLFVDDVDCGRFGKGREALRSFIAPVMTDFYRSQHYVCGQKIDFVDADHATGAVYCRAEHEDRDRWIAMAVCYFDTYARRGDEWYFARRKEQHWYAADVLERPSGPNFTQWPGTTIPEPGLPAAFPTWKRFWDAAGEDAIARRTNYPAGAG